MPPAKAANNLLNTISSPLHLLAELRQYILEPGMPPSLDCSWLLLLAGVHRWPDDSKVKANSVLLGLCLWGTLDRAQPGNNRWSKRVTKWSKTSATHRRRGQVTRLGINSQFEGGEVWLCFSNSVQDSERVSQKKKNSTGGVIFSWYLQPKASCYQKSSETHWVRNRKKKKRKVLWDLRQDVDGLRHPLAELSSRKTPPISHRGLEVPASAGLRGAQTRASPTPRRDTQCEQAWAQAWIPGCRLLNLPGTRKYELRGFCPQASVLWTKLHLRRLLLSFASTSTIYPTGAFLQAKQNAWRGASPGKEWLSFLQSWVFRGEGLLPTAPIRERGQIMEQTDTNFVC